MKLTRYTLLIEYRNGGTAIVHHSDEDDDAVKDLAVSNLRDADKERVTSINIIGKDTPNG